MQILTEACTGERSRGRGLEREIDLRTEVCSERQLGEERHAGRERKKMHTLTEVCWERERERKRRELELCNFNTQPSRIVALGPSAPA